MICPNCARDAWDDNGCDDCGATAAMIKQAEERPGGPAALLLNLMRHPDEVR
jgi:hypothetical protein